MQVFIYKEFEFHGKMHPYNTNDYNQILYLILAKLFIDKY